MTAPAREEGTTHQSVQRMHKNKTKISAEHLTPAHIFPEWEVSARSDDRPNQSGGGLSREGGHQANSV